MLKKIREIQESNDPEYSKHQDHIKSGIDQYRGECSTRGMTTLILSFFAPIPIIGLAAAGITSGGIALPFLAIPAYYGYKAGRGEYIKSKITSHYDPSHTEEETWIQSYIEGQGTT